jgi:hypothetical protein
MENWSKVHGDLEDKTHNNRALLQLGSKEEEEEVTETGWRIFCYNQARRGGGGDRERRHTFDGDVGRGCSLPWRCRVLWGEKTHPSGALHAQWSVVLCMQRQCRDLRMQ